MADKTMNIGNSTNNVNINVVGSIQSNKIKAPTTSGGTTYDVGSDGQVLKSNGTSVYWSTLDAMPEGELNIDFNGAATSTTSYLDRIVVGTITYTQHISATNKTI